MLLDEFRDVTKYYKETDKGVLTMCKVLEDMRKDAKKEGKLEVAEDLIKMGILSLEQISLATKIPFEKIKVLAGA